MTKKELQKITNCTVVLVAEDVTYDIRREGAIAHQLRSCSADVWETPIAYHLRSYNTFVATIDKSTGILYDYLRYVYGYTATSAQHISKFAQDYGATEILRYRPV